MGITDELQYFFQFILIRIIEFFIFNVWLVCGVFQSTVQHASYFWNELEYHADFTIQSERVKLDEDIFKKGGIYDEMIQLTELLEMTIIDKEMVEEKCDSLKLALRYCTDKLQEVNMDRDELKLLLKEQSTVVNSTSGAEITVYQVKQIQKQNLCLLQSLDEMRNSSEKDKIDYDRVLDDLKRLKLEIKQLNIFKDELLRKVVYLEEQKVFLEEQVDAALDAEKIILTLGEQKLLLEEKVVHLEKKILLLEDELFDFEALQDLNDHLLEENYEIEAGLIKKLELTEVEKAQILNDKNFLIDELNGREETIAKFKVLVQNLRNHCLSLEKEPKREHTEANLPILEMSYKKMFSSKKAHSMDINSKINDLDRDQMRQQIEYLTLFMPEFLMRTGGEYDAVLFLLFVRRLIRKTDILLGYVKEKIPYVDKIDKAAVLEGYSVQQSTFRCRFLFHIYTLQTVLHHYDYSLKSCEVDVFLKIASVDKEMASLEAMTDRYIELVKIDELDENTSLENLERCAPHFLDLLVRVLGREFEMNQLLTDSITSLMSACHGFDNYALALKELREGINQYDDSLSPKYITTKCAHLKQQLKIMKIFLPKDLIISHRGENREVLDCLIQCFEHSNEILKVLHEIVKMDIQELKLTTGVGQEQMKVERIEENSKINTRYDEIQIKLERIIENVSQIFEFIQEFNLGYLIKKFEPKVTPPIVLIAKSFKEELKQVDDLSKLLHEKEFEIEEVQTKLSEAISSNECLDRKMSYINAYYQTTIEKLERNVQEFNYMFNRKEREFDEMLTQLQKDIDSLENGKGELREKLKRFIKEVNIKKLSLTDSEISCSRCNESQSNTSVREESTLLKQELRSLNKLYHYEKNELLKLGDHELKIILDNLTTLPDFQSFKYDALYKLETEGKIVEQANYDSQSVNNGSFKLPKNCTGNDNEEEIRKLEVYFVNIEKSLAMRNGSLKKLDNRKTVIS